jgi:PRTRC genetic system protein E
MFTELMPLLRKRGLLITVSLVEGDTVRATVLPQKVSETEDNALTTPLAITGTAEELDRDLPQQLVEFVGSHLQLQSTLASAKAEMEAAAKAAREEARKKTTKPTSPAKALTPPTPETTEPEPEREPEPSLFAAREQSQTPAAQQEEEGGAE